MNEIHRTLEHYPLEEHYLTCGQYLRHTVDWEKIEENIDRNGVTFLDVSDVIELFPHLELDENYGLICYLSSEYHGIWGRIAAIRDGDDREPILSEETKKKPNRYFGAKFELPEGAAPPMEAIYHDGTDEGYLEAVLCSHFLDTIPYSHFTYRHWRKIVSDPPLEMEDQWDVFVRVLDWAPRRVGNSIIAIRRDVEDGFGASDGKDRMYLAQYWFVPHLDAYHALAPKRTRSMYKSQIEGHKRYNARRHCCVFSENSVRIAEEKGFDLTWL